MEMKNWSSYCGLGIIGWCLRPKYGRTAENEEKSEESQPVVLDTSHMGNFILFHHQVKLSKVMIEVVLQTTKLCDCRY